MAIGTDKLDALYRKLKPKGVTMTALLSKACGVALTGHPLLYAQCTPDGSGVTYNERINIAMAVAMPDGGLITPVLKDADTTDIYTMSRNWADLVSELAPAGRHERAVWGWGSCGGKGGFHWQGLVGQWGSWAALASAPCPACSWADLVSQSALAGRDVGAGGQCKRAAEFRAKPAGQGRPGRQAGTHCTVAGL
jgi:hypothetical protein